MRSGVIRALGIVLAGALCALAGQAASQTAFPNRPIRIIVPYAPGGSPDVLARTIGQAASDGLGQQVVVENRPGGSGMIAVEAVLRAPADGYTLLIGDSGVYSIGPHMNPALGLDVLRDFAPVTLLVYTPMFLIVNGTLPVRTVQEFVALARQKPGTTIGSSGNGTAHHLAVEATKAATRADITHVPYKGAGQSIPAVVAGDVSAVFAALNTVAQHAKAGRVRVLASATSKRTRLTPDLPTMTEAGVPGCEIDISIGFLVPAKTPRDVIERLHSEFARALSRPEVTARLDIISTDPVGAPPDEYAATMRRELSAFGAMVRATGARTQ